MPYLQVSSLINKLSDFIFFPFVLRDTEFHIILKFCQLVSNMSDTGRVYQFFNFLLYTTAKDNGEGSGAESTFAAVAVKIMQQTDIRGIVVDNQITNVLRKKIGTVCARLEQA